MNRRNNKKKKKKNIIKMLESGLIPFMQLMGNEKLLFIVDDDKWTLNDTSEWLNIFNNVFSNVKFCVFPKSMFTSVQKITDEEYSVLNNILKRCNNSNEVNNEKI